MYLEEMYLIFKNLDHEEYDSLSDERKQAYILKLSQNYQTICNKINY